MTPLDCSDVFYEDMLKSSLKERCCMIDNRAGFLIGAVGGYMGIRWAISFAVHNSDFFHQAFKERWITIKREDSSEEVFVKSTLLFAAGAIALATYTGQVNHHDQWQRNKVMLTICVFSVSAGLATIVAHTLFNPTLDVDR